MSKDLKKEDIINAIHNSAGIINNIAKQLNVAWHTAKKHIDEDKDLLQALQDEIEKNIDKAENVILNALDKEDVQTAKWFLSTIGKNRGYTEKQEVEHTGEVNIIVDIEKDE